MAGIHEKEAEMAVPMIFEYSGGKEESGRFRGRNGLNRPPYRPETDKLQEI